MTLQGVIVLELLGLCLAATILSFIRSKKLYVGYGVIWLSALAGFMLLVATPPLLGWLTRAVGAFFPVSALSLIAFALIFLVLVYFTVQLTLLSIRLTEVCRYVAMQELDTKLAAERASARAVGLQGSSE